MQFLDPKPRAYAFRRRGLQDGIPEGMKKCRDCGQVKPATIAHWRRNSSLRLEQPCRECRP